MKQEQETTQINMAVHAYTENGREIREYFTGEGRTKALFYSVQPRNDNYWLHVKTPASALQAFKAPHRFRGTDKKLRAQYPGV